MISQKKIQANNFTFDCFVSGNESDELVILLHGFPESSYMWVKLMEDISEKGFYCVAPDQRGYSEGASPINKKEYALELLGQDIIAISKALDREKFHLIGHDWGAAVGWGVVANNPDNIISWSGMSVPHVQGYSKAVLGDNKQRLKSLYTLFFQLPFLPEFFMRLNNFKMLRVLWKKSSKEEVAYNLSIYKRKTALSTALNYYRGNLKMVTKAARGGVIPNVTVPTLFIWGQYDPFIGEAAVEMGHKYATGYYNYVKIKGGHWLIQTRYNEVKAPVIDHLLKFKTS